ncbi:amino acid adenylation domain-containing protein [Flavobacterium oreochromis]|uniref:amino acid adenylation domain-containing protein n=1 Tax=Flavobacterium oreochromis TaxID=2906078 RepID=UPI00385A4A6A
MKLTLPQLDIYFEQLIYPEEAIYNIGAKISIEGILNFKVFENAYIELIKQHDAYRTYLKIESNQVDSIIVEEIRPLEYIDFTEEIYEEESVLDFMQKEFKKPFDIENDKFLYRFVLIKVAENKHFLFSVYHHIITDGWGTSLMFTRLVKNYNEILELGEVTSEYPFTYQNFVEDDKKYFESPQFTTDKKYWVDKFSTLPESLFEKIDPANKTNISSREKLVLKRDTYNQLIDLAVKTKSSSFHIILSLLYTYFGKRYQKEFISIGLPVLNRSSTAFKKTVGLFMGVNPLVIEINQESTFAELVETTKIQLRQDYRYQRLPLGQLVKELGTFNEKERIFNMTLSYEKQDYSSHFQDTITKVVPLSHEAERVALALYIREFDANEDVEIDFDYHTNYFTESEIKKVVSHFQILLQNVLKNPDFKLKELEYISENERHQLVYDFNDTKVDYPKDKTIVELFEVQAAKTPDNVAVQDSLISFTYKELQFKSNAVATYLTSKFGLDKEPIGIIVNRSADLIVLLLGILKSGKSYIPIDPLLPKERIKYIIHQSNSRVLIIEDELLNDFKSTKESSDKVSLISKKEILEFEGNTSFNSNSIKVEDTAYIIYTSGSTGNPKGVEIRHKALCNFLVSIQKQLGIESQDTLFSVTTYSFDISILEFFVPLISGACVYVASKEVLGNIDALRETLTKVNPSIIQATPSFYQMLFNSDWEGNKKLKVLCGGDSLNESLAKQLLDSCQEVWNMYGPTETTIWSSCKKIEKPSDASNIGKPIANTQIYIVDANLNLLPSNTVGRIFIAGDGLAKGYYNNPDLTSERFIKNPFNQGTLMYEVGDLGKWNNEGEIEFLGRNDFQVKIRGFRIELGEIESKLQENKQIIQAVVDAKEINGQKYLVAYYTEKGESELDTTAVKSYLQERLPDYMVPNFFVKLMSIPLTPNGKVNRKALPEISEENIVKKAYITPQTAIEAALVSIWQEILNIEEIGITDNFFELGGHSLLAGKIVNEISKRLNKNLSLKYIFQNQTIQELAKSLEIVTAENIIIPKASLKAAYPITKDQESIWLATQMEDFSNAYNMYSIFTIKGIINYQSLENAINQVIEENEILRTNFIESQGEVLQSIHQKVDFKIDVHKIDKEELSKSITEFVSYEFNLNTDLLLKAAIFEVNDNEKYLVFLTHHIILDGISLELLLTKLISLYKTKEVNTVINDFQFKDYTEWVRQEQNSKSFASFFNSKVTKTKALISNSSLGYTKSKIKVFDKEQYSNLKEISNTNKTSVFTVIVTAVNVVLSKILQQQEITLATIFSGRDHTDLESQIGMFVKTLPLQLNIDQESSLHQLFKICNDQLLLINENNNAPLQINLNQLTDFMIVFQKGNKAMENKINFGEFILERNNVIKTKSRFPIVFNFFENDTLRCKIEYSEVIEETYLQLILDKLEILIDLLGTSLSAEISSLDLTTIEEKKILDSVEIDFDF